MSDRAIPRTALGGESRPGGDQIARGLGYLSIGLGLVELVAAQALCRALALEGRETLVRAYGAREVANGVAILASRDPAPWMLGRVAGDVIDLATLASAQQGADGEQRENIGLAIAAVAGIAALDVLCLRALESENGGPKAVAHQLRSDGAGRWDSFGTIADDRRTANGQTRWTIKESQMGRIVVADMASGHEFAFRVETVRGRQTLGAFAPKWADGEAPASARKYVIEARDLAEKEAVDQGWVGL